MSLELKLTSLGAPLPSARRGYAVQIDVHKDGDTVAYGNGKFVITRSLTPGGPVGKNLSPIYVDVVIKCLITMQSSKANIRAPTFHFSSSFLYQAKVYVEHKHNVTVARFNPSGYYVASADDSGYVRVWSYTHAENMIKKASKQLG